jgi:alanine-synthesizing transaminase
MFSSRLPTDLRPNALARAIATATTDGAPLIDLTVSNPTSVGFDYPPDLFGSLSSPAVATYRPEPLGLRRAREAVAGEYGRRGLDVPWEHIVLTASTSEAYSFLFKLLCAPQGDRVLVPVPSYPLFEHLTALDGVTAAPYRLDYGGRWGLDFASVDGQWNARTRAVLAVSPNNPTGSVLTADELEELGRRAAERDVALVIDEVFADYALEPAHDTHAAVPPRALTFRLGGLSKSAALPQLKLGWIAVEGPDGLVTGALERLELIGDTYLSVSTPVQVAAPDLLAAAGVIRAEVERRIRGNYRRLHDLARAYPGIDVLPAAGGWSAVLRIPAGAGEEEFVLQLIEQDRVIVHPGFFFDFPHEAFVVVSLLPEAGDFETGVRRVLERANA